MKVAFSAFCAIALAASAAAKLPASAPVPVALLSVATDAATLVVATPESLRPAPPPAKPAPFPPEVLSRLDGFALVAAMRDNERVAAENAKAAAVAVQADLDVRAARERTARHELSLGPLGRAVAKAPAFFSETVAGAKGLAALPVGGDGYVVPEGGARFVRLLFGEVESGGSAGTSAYTANAAARLAMEVSLKVEDAAGKTVSFEKFVQSATYPADGLAGKKRDEAILALVGEAVEAVVAKVAAIPRG